MDRQPKKPCKHCGLMGHFAYACYQNPKRALKALKRTQIKRSSKPMNKIGKTTKQWLITRATWIRKNPPPIDGLYWECYLRIHPWCPPLLTVDKELVTRGVGLLTVDHIVARTRDHSKKFALDNLKPACGYCNDMKGSKSLDEVKPPPVQ